MYIADSSRMDIDDPIIKEFIERARIARLATANITECKPHLVPVVFVFDDNHFLIPGVVA